MTRSPMLLHIFSRAARRTAISEDGGTCDVAVDDGDGEEEDEGADAVEADDSQIFRRRKHGQCRYATIELVLQSIDTL